MLIIFTGLSYTQLIQDKFQRDPAVPADQDLAMRTFDLVANTISIQFQYAADSITASRRLFTKPPKPDYECEIIYDPDLTRSFNVGIIEYNISE